MKQRILYASAGYTTHDRRFLRAIVDGGWAVGFARFDRSQHSLDQRHLPPAVSALPWLGSAGDPKESLPTESSLVADFARLVEDFDPSLVHAGPIPSVAHIARLAASRPLVAMSWGSDLLVDALEEPHRSRASAALRASAAVLVDCETVKASAISLGADPHTITVFPWGVDLPNFAPRPIPGGPTLRVFSMRSHEPIYGIDVAIHALALARDSGLDVQLTIAGDGSLNAELKSLAAELGCAAATRWIGRAAEDALPQLLADHHVHLSTSYSDGSSISLLQAMASGRPSIVSSIPSSREWLSDSEDGWLFEVGNPSALALSFSAAAAALHRGELASMGRRARRTAEMRADWSENVKLLHRAYRSATHST